MNSDSTNVQDITLEDIEKYLQKDSYQKFLKQIPPSVFTMALNEQDKPKVIKIILQVLQDRDPQNATETYAQKMAEEMQKVAEKALQERNRKK